MRLCREILDSPWRVLAVRLGARCPSSRVRLPSDGGAFDCIGHDGSGSSVCAEDRAMGLARGGCYSSWIVNVFDGFETRRVELRGRIWLGKFVACRVPHFPSGGAIVCSCIIVCGGMGLDRAGGTCATTVWSTRVVVCFEFALGGVASRSTVRPPRARTRPHRLSTSAVRLADLASHDDDKQRDSERGEHGVISYSAERELCRLTTRAAEVDCAPTSMA